MRNWVIGLALTTMLASSPARAEDLIVRPQSAPGPLDNPLKGWCPYPVDGIAQPYSMVYLYIPWSELEPEPGRYAFDEWERKGWNVPAAKDKHIVFRVYVDYPTRPSGLPAWLRSAGVKETAYEAHGGGKSPDYDDPRVVAGMERLIEALGRRYDSNPRVAFVQLGLLGFWGEWHTYPVERLKPSLATERRVIEAYHKAFPHKILMGRVARDDLGRQPWVGFHDDMFPEDTDNGQDWSFLATIRSAGRSDNWKTAAIGGEMEPFAAKRWLGEGFPRTLDRLESAHFTWVGPYGPALERTTNPDYRTRAEALVRRMGYQYRLVEIRHPRSIGRERRGKVSIRAENEGVAPFYYPWKVELALLDDSGKPIEVVPTDADPRKWLPGPFRIDADLPIRSPAGRYRLAIGIRDPWLDRPSVGFANQLDRKEGWTILSDVTVSNE